MTGDELKAARNHEGLTQQALATNLGVAIATIRSWESGRTAINPDAAARIRVLCARYYDDRPEHHILYELPDGTGVVVWRNSAYRIISGQAGFSADDVQEARTVFDAGDDASLADWLHLELTQAAAAYVAATYPAVGNA